MATHYRKRHYNQPQALSLSKRLAFLGGAFVIGYMSASLIDFRQLSTWLNTHSPFDGTSLAKSQLASKPTPPPKPKLEFYTLLTTNHGAAIVAPPVPAPAKTLVAPTPAVLPTNTATPVTTLAKNVNTTPSKSPVVNGHPPAMVKPVLAHVTPKQMDKPVPASAQSNKLGYTIQVAAFRTRQDAEHVKASLLLKGFDASVIAIQSQRVAWFRVMVGPFASHEQAQRAQTILAQRERMNGMIRKMDA